MVSNSGDLYSGISRIRGISIRGFEFRRLSEYLENFKYEYYPAYNILCPDWNIRLAIWLWTCLQHLKHPVDLQDKCFYFKFISPKLNPKKTKSWSSFPIKLLLRNTKLYMPKFVILISKHLQSFPPQPKCEEKVCRKPSFIPIIRFENVQVEIIELQREILFTPKSCSFNAAKALHFGASDKILFQTFPSATSKYDKWWWKMWKKFQII